MVTDVQLIVNQMRRQLLALERQLFYLHKRTSHSEPPGTAPQSFSALRGMWSGVIVNDQDFAAARLKMPQDV